MPTVCGDGMSDVWPVSGLEADFDALRLPRDDTPVVIDNPISVDQTIVRTTLIPGLLETFGVNANYELPQRIFEVGNISRVDPEAETGALDIPLVAAGAIGPKIDYLPSEHGGIPRVFSFFMDALLCGTPMQLVNGGRSRRSYTYIDDAIECIYRIIENRGGGCSREIFNVGSDQNEVSIRELAEQMRSLYAAHFLSPGETLPPLVDVSAEAFYGKGYDDAGRLPPDVSKLRALGWEPRRDMKATFGDAMAFYLEPGAAGQAEFELRVAVNP